MTKRLIQGKRLRSIKDLEAVGLAAIDGFTKGFFSKQLAATTRPEPVMEACDICDQPAVWRDEWSRYCARHKPEEGHGTD